MDPEVSKLKNDLAKILAEIEHLTFRMNTHIHNSIDFTTPLVTEEVAGATYGGYVESNAASTPFPSGWTVNNFATGKYTITHSLGTTSYVVTATPTGNASHMISIDGENGSNSFIINAFDLSNTPVNTNFFFILKVQDT